MKTFRISFSGAGGTGKGTVGEIIAQKLRVPFLRSQNQRIGKSMGFANYDQPPSRQLEFAYQHAILQAQIAQEVAMMSRGYVSERCVADYIPYYEDRKFLTQEPYWGIVKEHLQWYDAIFFAVPDFVPGDIAGSWKERDMERRQKTSDGIEKFLVENFKGRLCYLQGTIEERVQKALQHLATWEMIPSPLKMTSFTPTLTTTKRS